jgi:phage minor structural protein
MKETIGILSNRMPSSLPFYNDLHQRSLDDFTDYITFSVPSNHEGAEKITADRYILYPVFNEGYKLYKIKEVKEIRESGERRKEVYAEISAQDDLIKDVVRPATHTSASLETVITTILSNSDWKVGHVDDFGIKDYNIDDYPNKLEALVDAVKAYGGELEFEYIVRGTKIISQIVNVYEQVGERTGKTFTYGKDLVGIERIEDTTKLVTALIGVGPEKDGIKLSFYNQSATQLGAPEGFEKPTNADWVGSLEAFQKYSTNGKHIFGVFKDDKAQSSYELFNNTLEALKKYSKPLMTYKAKVALLERIAGYEHEVVRLGDTVMIIDKEMGITVKARIRKLQRSITNPESGGVELGDYIPVVPPINDRISAIQSKIRDREDIWNKAQEVPQIQQELAQKADKGDLFSVPSQRMKIRYVRDYINGNTVNSHNHWVELQVWRKGINLAKGIIPTGTETITNASYITDGIIDSLSYASMGTGLQYIELDLGQVYDDVEYIHTWHYYSDGRTYNDHRVDVSEDGLTWVHLYSSELNGSHIETSEGLIVPVNSSAIISTQKKEQNQVVIRVGDLEDFKLSTEEILPQKVNLVDYNNKVTQLENDIAAKAGLDYVDGQLLLKADNTRVDTLANDVANKADKLYVDDNLILKADKSTTYTKTEVDNALNSKVSTTTYDTDINGIVSRLDSAETRITQTENEITLKASKTEVEQAKDLATASTVKPVFSGNSSNISVNQGTFETTPEGNIRITGTGSDVMLYLNPSSPFSGGKNERIAIRVRYIADNGTPSWQGQIYYQTATHTDSESYTKKGIPQPAKDGKWHTISVDMHDLTTGGTDWKDNNIIKVRLDFWNYAIWEVQFVVIGTVSTDFATPESVDALEQRISTAETSITQNSNEISLRAKSSDVYTKTETDTKVNAKADQTTVDNLTTRVSNAEAQLTVHSNEIAARVKTVDYDADMSGVVTRLDTAEANITANANEISLKASQSSVDTLNTRMSDAEAQLTVHSNEISTKVTLDEVKDEARRSGNEVVKARYVRIYSNGNTVNTSNHLVEVKVMKDDVNLAKGLIATSSTTMSYPERMTDEVIDTYQYSSFGSGRQWVQFDLGQIYDDIDYIQVWFYWADGRSYNYEVEVSEDSINWMNLFDTSRSGRPKATSSGFVILVNKQASISSLASSIKQTANSINLRVDNVEGTANTAKSSADTANNKIDNLKVGGRNLLYNSTGEITNENGEADGWAAGTVVEHVENKTCLTIHTASTTEVTKASERFRVKPNTKYAVRALVKGTTNAKGFDIFFLGRPLSSANNYDFIHNMNAVLPTDKLTEKFWTFTTESTEEEGYIRIDNNGSSDGLNATVWFSEIQIEEGDKHTTWKPSLDDTEQRMASVEQRLSNAEIAISDSSIISTVMNSTEYQVAMEGKANSDDLAGYATTGQLSEMETSLNNSIDDKISALDIGSYVKSSELSQTSSDLTAKFSRAGGVNLIKNSVGFAGFEFWNAPTPDRYSVVSHSALDYLGFGSGFYFPYHGTSPRYITQEVNVVSGNPYTLSWFVNKTNSDPATNNAGAFYVQVLEYDASGNTLYTMSYRYGSEVTTNGYEEHFETFTPVTNKITVRLYAYQNVDATATGLMLNVGDVPLQWTMAPGEIYNTNVRMDMKGLKVSKFEGEKETKFTVMTPERFAGFYDVNGDGVIEDYDGSPDEVFKMDEDSFIMKKAVIKEEQSMGPMKIIKIESASNTGWAFVPSE